MDNRAVTPVVGKLLAAGLAVLYIASVSGLLLGGVLPDYRTTAGDELADRVLADVAGHVERAVPDSDARVDARVRLDLPATIRGERYALAARNGTLHLDHPEDALDSRTSVQLPSKVIAVEGNWTSGSRLVVRVTGSGTNHTVALEESP